MNNPSKPKNELLAHAQYAKDWGKLADIWPNPEYEGRVFVGNIDDDGNEYPVFEIDTDQWDQADQATSLAKFYAAANPLAVLELIQERTEAEEKLANLESECFEGYPTGTRGVFDEVKELSRQLSKAQLEVESVHRTNSELSSQLLSTQADHANMLKAVNTLMEKWHITADGGLDDEKTVLMALSENEVAEGYRLDGHWFYSDNRPTYEIPTHWMDIPRHPMDTQP